VAGHCLSRFVILPALIALVKGAKRERRALPRSAGVPRRPSVSPPPAAMLRPVVASRRISTKEAATLGYLFQLLLQSVQGVNKEISRTRIDCTNESDGLRQVLQQTASLTRDA